VHACGKSVAAMRPVLPAIMIVVMLTIMLFSPDVPVLHILGMVEALALLPGHDTIGFGTGLDVVDALLTTIKTRRLALGQATGGGTLIDAGFLTRFTLIDTRRIGLGKSSHRQDGAKYGNGFDVFHDRLLLDIGQLFPRRHLKANRRRNQPGNCKAL